MNYNIKTRQAEWHDSDGLRNDRELYDRFRRDPRFRPAYIYHDEWDVWETDVFPALEIDGVWVRGVDAIERELAFDRQKSARLDIEKEFTPLDSQVDHPTKRGWGRDLSVRKTQYDETHVVLDEFKYTDSTHHTAYGGPVYVSYRGFNAKLSTPTIQDGERTDIYTVPIDISGKDKDTSFWDGEAVIEASSSLSSRFGRLSLDIDSPYDYRANRALVMGIMACAWEIDRSLHVSVE